MASIRRKLLENVNESKNTRMNIMEVGLFANFKPDELAHISRYCKIGELVMSEAKRLGRPLDCLEAGCGQAWVLRFLHKAVVCTKSEQVRSYRGYDIDPAVLTDFWTVEDRDIHDASWFNLVGGKILLQDLTVDPTFTASPAEDGLYDMFWTTEVIEHMKPHFVEPWLADAASRLRPGGLAYVSTPNSDGSNEKLPKDHVYEWGFGELRDLLEKYFEVKSVSGVFIQMPKFNRARQQWPERMSDEMVQTIKTRFDPFWQRVILAAPFPEVANNCAWQLRKKA